jgi:hypothetical protein
MIGMWEIEERMLEHRRLESQHLREEWREGALYRGMLFSAHIAISSLGRDHFEWSELENEWDFDFATLVKLGRLGLVNSATPSKPPSESTFRLTARGKEWLRGV